MELGVTRLYLVKTERSYSIKLREDRLRQIIVSAIEQSNNPYLLDFELVELSCFLESEKDNLLCLSTEIEFNGSTDLNNKPNMILIGPEGGFSSEEIKLMRSFNIPIKKVSRPIMRTDTAFVFAQGLLEKL